MFITWIIILPICGSLLPLFAVRAGAGAAAWAAASATATALGIALSHTPDVFAGGEVHVAWAWVPAIGLDLALRYDGLAMVFVLLILGIGLLIILYAYFYFGAASQVIGRFLALILLFQGAMLGLVLADNLLLLLLFWEATSIVSFLLVAFKPHGDAAQHGARLALVITATGGLALLAAFILIEHIVGSFSLSVVLAQGDQIRNHVLYQPILVCLLIGAFTKSAQFPVHIWLPSAMSAPTPASAYLHSATMVKAGVFLLARFFPVLANTDSWFYWVAGTGLITFLIGAYLAIFRHDIKGLLAYSTISHLGLIVFLFGLGTPLGAVAGLFHALNHALFKASLFMAAGIIDQATGTRDMRQLNGLWSFMPITAALAMVAAAAMAGVPLLNGFLSKEMFFAETIDQHGLGLLTWLLPVLATLGGILAVAYSLRFIHDVFFNGQPQNLERIPEEPPRWMRIPMEILVALCLIVGIFPEQTVRPLLDLGVRGLLGFTPEYSLAVWHGVSAPFVMSLIALSGGALLYRWRYRLFALYHQETVNPRIDAFWLMLQQRLTRLLAVMAQFCATSSWVTSLAWLVGMIVYAAISLFYVQIHWPSAMVTASWSFESTEIFMGVVLIFIIGMTLVTPRCRQQPILALILVSFIGLGISLVFAYFSAPDLALTQLTIEVITTMLFLSVLYFVVQLPADPAPTTARWWLTMRRSLHGALAIGAGIGATCLTWYILTTQTQSDLADYFLTQALPEAGANNVVNGILVDFRAFDTLGEITVLAIAAVTIFAVLLPIHLPLADVDDQGHAWAQPAHPTMLAMISRPLLPIALVVALFLLLRGHHDPGGGFVAGLVASVALILQQIASGQVWTAHRLRLRYTWLIGGGLLLAVVTGLMPLLFERPFLATAVAHGHWPGFGEVELASALFFDIGVLCVVFGVVMLILDHLARIRLSRRTTVDATLADSSPKSTPPA
jgi:multicomponent K+:H+ antiporter subunit A